MCEIISKLIMNTPSNVNDIVLVFFGQISDIVLMFRLLNIEQLNSKCDFTLVLLLFIKDYEC